MTTLYGRTYDLRIGQPGETGRRWEGRGNESTPGREGLQITFEVERKNNRKANKLRLTMTNLSIESVGFIEQTGNVITLSAGYEQNNGVLFEGQIVNRGVTTTFEGTDRVTSIEAGGSELELSSTRFARSFAAGTSYRTVLSAIIDAIGVGAGNVNTVVGLDLTYSTGYTFAGRARAALDEVVNQLGEGYSWSIQDGQILILDRDETTAETAVLLTVDTGLIGAPQRQKNGLELVSLLRPELKPGRLVKVQSRGIDGFYKCTQVTHSGEFRGANWYTSINARQI